MVLIKLKADHFIILLNWNNLSSFTPRTEWRHVSDIMSTQRLVEWTSSNKCSIKQLTGYSLGYEVFMLYPLVYVWCNVRSPDQCIHDKHVQKPENKKPSLQADTPTPSMDTCLIKYLLLVTGKTAHGQNGRKRITFKETEISELASNLLNINIKHH